MRVEPRLVDQPTPVFEEMAGAAEMPDPVGMARPTALSTITGRCRRCGYGLRLRELAAGAVLHCPRCRHALAPGNTMVMTDEAARLEVALAHVVASLDRLGSLPGIRLTIEDVAAALLQTTPDRVAHLRDEQARLRHDIERLHRRVVALMGLPRRRREEPARQLATDLRRVAGWLRFHADRTDQALPAGVQTLDAVALRRAAEGLDRAAGLPGRDGLAWAREVRDALREVEAVLAEPRGSSPDAEQTTARPDRRRELRRVA